MKQKLSISIEEETIRQLEQFVKKSIFRNKSHFVETAIEKYMEENNGK